MSPKVWLLNKLNLHNNDLISLYINVIVCKLDLVAFAFCVGMLFQGQLRRITVAVAQKALQKLNQLVEQLI